MSRILDIDLSAPLPPARYGRLRAGGLSPKGQRISVSSRCISLSHEPWLPVMGEFHYARVPRAEWAVELAKCRAGGVEIAASYCFWIHHEEIEGIFDFTGDRDVRAFVEECSRQGLWAWLRLGPWAHGECRNGGFPDWLVSKGCQTRTDDPLYLAFVRRFWEEIHCRLEGLFFHQGGPILGFQIENELMQSRQHLETLALLAEEIGLAAPLVSATGWGDVDLPGDRLLPVYGCYADGFWERSVTDWPERYRKNFFFRHTRNDTAIGSDLNPSSSEGDTIDPAAYPYLACETGGGMPSSYHRRIDLDPQDTVAMAWVMAGSGCSLQGYYMLHGGINPEGRLSTLQESQATGYPNDLPVKSYFADAPLGDWGQVNPSFRPLRQLHAFLSAFGRDLACCPMTLPAQAPAGLDDQDTLRWAVRHNGSRAFLFVNTHERHARLPVHSGVQFLLRTADGDRLVPSSPIDIPSGASFVLPVEVNVGGLQIGWATLQPFTRFPREEGEVVVLSEIEGLPPRVMVRERLSSLTEARGFSVAEVEGGLELASRGEGTARASFSLLGGRTVELVVLTRADAEDSAALPLNGELRLLKSRSILYLQGDELWGEAESPEDLAVEDVLTGRRWPSALAFVDPGKAALEPVSEPGPLRTVSLGHGGVAEAPDDAAFSAGAARFSLTVEPSAPEEDGLFLEIDYVGDAARLSCGGRLLCDHFYNGSPWLVGLDRWRKELGQGPLDLQILPFDPRAPIYLEKKAAARIEAQGTCRVLSVRLQRRLRRRLVLEGLA